jgi:hypothetical protein
MEEFMSTVKEFKDFELEYITNDKIGVYLLTKEGASSLNKQIGWDGEDVTSFVWRTNKGIKPYFKGAVEVKLRSGRVVTPKAIMHKGGKLEWGLDGDQCDIVEWRPLLDQSAVNPSDYKPVPTQAMDDIEYELSLHRADSELLASLTDFMVKNGIGRIGESCIDVAIRELSERFNIDQRTPKQKAVDEMFHVAYPNKEPSVLLSRALEKLYDAGYHKC